MSEYRRQIVLVSAVAIVVALSLGLGIVYLPLTQHSTVSSSTSSSLTAASTTTTAAFTSSTVASSSTSTASAISSTTFSSTGVESSVTACTPSSSYIATTTLTEQSTTTTEQVGYDGTVCNFGDGYFEPPSAILIPANTLTWTSFRLQENGSYYVAGSIHFLSLPSASGANITVAVYMNGKLRGSSTTPVSQLPNEVTNSSLMPSSNSTGNSIFVLAGVTPTGGVGTQTSSTLNLNNSTISIAFMSDKPLWLCGWTPDDMSKGTGSEFGQSMGQLNGTYEWTASGLSLPISLPQPTTTVAFELQISGDYSA